MGATRSMVASSNNSSIKILQTIVRLSLVLLPLLGSGCISMNELPDYVVINKPECLNTQILTTPARTVSFPLSAEDQQIISLLVEKFKNEQNCAGLAAPQIGFHKRIIVFEVKDDPHLKKWRPDLTDTMPMALWINPTYTPLGSEKVTDFEGCFSVDKLGGEVARYKKIAYQAYDEQGRIIKGEAEGFLARVIQHEIDHINGTLFIDLVPSDKLLPIEIYRKKRSEAIKSKS
jgi:peptide deformylase